MRTDTEILKDLIDEVMGLCNDINPVVHKLTKTERLTVKNDKSRIRELLVEATGDDNLSI